MLLLVVLVVAWRRVEELVVAWIEMIVLRVARGCES